MLSRCIEEKLLSVSNEEKDEQRECVVAQIRLDTDRCPSLYLWLLEVNDLAIVGTHTRPNREIVGRWVEALYTCIYGDQSPEEATKLKLLLIILCQNLIQFLKCQRCRIVFRSNVRLIQNNYLGQFKLSVHVERRVVVVQSGLRWYSLARLSEWRKTGR